MRFEDEIRGVNQCDCIEDRCAVIFRTAESPFSGSAAVAAGLSNPPTPGSGEWGG